MLESMGEKRRRAAALVSPTIPEALVADLAELAELALAAVREAAELAAADLRRKELEAQRLTHALTVDDVMCLAGYKTRKAAARLMREHFPFFTVGRRLFIPRAAWEEFKNAGGYRLQRNFRFCLIPGGVEARERLKGWKVQGLDSEVPVSMLPDLWDRRRRHKRT